MKKFVCAQTQSLKDFTDCNYPQGSFCFARLLRDRDIKVNGVRACKGAILHPDDEVTFYTTPKEEAAISHSVIYEDGNILVADKFSGVTSEGLCAELNEKGVFYPVHRLDRNTCGLIVYAKTEEAEGELLKAFKTGGVQKTYLAACADNFKKDKNTLTAYLLKDEKNSRVGISDRPLPKALKIITEYAVLKREGGICLAEITLHTGRTHQIRAHLAHIGCPVIGDEKYGDGELNKKYGVRRQCLVSKKMAFSSFSGGLSYLNGFCAVSLFNVSLGKCRPER